MSSLNDSDPYSQDFNSATGGISGKFGHNLTKMVT